MRERDGEQSLPASRAHSFSSYTPRFGTSCSCAAWNRSDRPMCAAVPSRRLAGPLLRVPQLLSISHQLAASIALVEPLRGRKLAQSLKDTYAANPVGLTVAQEGAEPTFSSSLAGSTTPGLRLRFVALLSCRPRPIMPLGLTMRARCSSLSSLRNCWNRSALAPPSSSGQAERVQPDGPCPWCLRFVAPSLLLFLSRPTARASVQDASCSARARAPSCSRPGRRARPISALGRLVVLGDKSDLADDGQDHDPGAQPLPRAMSRAAS